ncbi:cobyric acid synthase [Sphingomonas changnyeongensis]|uniref:Cobyric acid synthase n=1 Tax=Sphingomonas changnyeongensis TaxID=2698679 RepID=A0A7Z2S9I9_9SPHN|nr:cobyric acid synthase [Sphingomonas changnyeongensis]QHL90794.1 cobyric acid synthase [Sphingomonas changnyeongensis]
MIQGTGSDVGKSLLVAGLCRIARRRGIRVAPFKPQNMSNNAAACADGGEIGRAQALQARAAGLAPHTDFNPVLLKPASDRRAQIVVHGRVQDAQDAARYMAGRGALMPAVAESFTRLAAAFDLVIVEGAGSPAEINLRAGDIANMGFARRFDVPVILAGDIDRGGVIAALVGTQAVLDPEDAAMIRGFLVNKFRGDPALFDDGLAEIVRRTGWPSLGVIPWIAAASRLPAEDAVVLERGIAGQDAPLTIVAPMLSRIANFDDADPLRLEPGVDFRFVPPGRPLPRNADVVLLLGTKSTLADLAFLRAQGWDTDLLAHVRGGGRVLGLCGGFQMLGRRIRDPDGIDGPAGAADGLGLLDIETVMTPGKQVRPAAGRCALTGAPVQGYEIHAGNTHGPGLARPLLNLDHGPDGAVSADGRIAGSYLHGLFGSDAFRRAWLNRVRPGVAGDLAYEAEVEAALDGVADALEAAVDLDALFAAARTPLLGA